MSNIFERDEFVLAFVVLCELAELIEVRQNPITYSLLRFGSSNAKSRAAPRMRGYDRGVLLRTRVLLDLAEIGKLRICWEGPLAVTALEEFSTYTLALQQRFLCGPIVNIDRLYS